jgi:hypothetical protein
LKVESCARNRVDYTPVRTVAIRSQSPGWNVSRGDTA